MERRLAELANREHDLVIIGGGAFGACAAWEAASRGLSVALIEKNDFSGSTSANHGKFVHGGIRYLQHLDLNRVRESCRERSAFLRIAPHLVRPMPIIMPTYGHGLEGRLILGMGLALYDLVVYDRNRGIADPDRQVPRGRILDRQQYLELFPNLDVEDLTGAGCFYDGQFFNPPRLALAFLESAVDAGARVANYVAATGFVRTGDRVTGVAARDVLGGDTFEIRGRLVLNAAGPWAPELVRQMLNVEIRPTPQFSRDAGFIIRGRPSGDYTLACRLETKDPDAVLSRKGRHVFLAPWRDHTYVGTWHVVHTKGPEDVSVRDEEVEGFIGEINASHPGLGMSIDDVTFVQSGLTLFGENKPGQKDLRFAHRSLLIDHEQEHGIPGLVTLVGVRATMSRGMGEQAIDLVLAKGDYGKRPSKTDRTPIWGGRIDRIEDLVRDAASKHRARWPAEVMRSLVHNYGSEYGRIVALAEDEPSLAATLGDSLTLKAQVVHALRHEMAQTLGDVVFRRTDLGTAGHPGGAAIEQCALVMADQLGWDASRQRLEIEEVLKRFPNFPKSAAA